MSGKELLHVGVENAQVIGGAAVATGGYLYFNKVRGFIKPLIGCIVTFAGGVEFHAPVEHLLGFETPVAAAFASASTLGVLYAIQQAAFRVDLSALVRKGKG